MQNQFPVAYVEHMIFGQNFLISAKASASRKEPHLEDIGIGDIHLVNKEDLKIIILCLDLYHYKTFSIYSINFMLNLKMLS